MYMASSGRREFIEVSRAKESIKLSLKIKLYQTLLLNIYDSSDSLFISIYKDVGLYFYQRKGPKKKYNVIT